MSQNEPKTDKYASACVRIAEEVAAALTEALGGEWAEWGEGGLADGVRLLTQQRDDAEKRGALKALSAFLETLDSERADLNGDRASEAQLVSDALRYRIARLEAGEVTL